MALRVNAETLLFGVPEDTQRRLLAAPQVRPSRISRVFVAAAVPDQLGGLPGRIPALSPSLTALQGTCSLLGHAVAILLPRSWAACCRWCCKYVSKRYSMTWQANLRLSTRHGDETAMSCFAASSARTVLVSAAFGPQRIG